MRYVLLFTDGMITVGDYDRLSSNFIEGKKSWRSAVQQLVNTVRRRHQGKITNLEIQSHGKPGVIVAPPENITYENVAQLGGMLRQIMVSGGLIEIMACNVAAVGYYAYKNGDGTLQYPPAVLDEYWGGLEKDPVRMGKIDDHNVVVRLDTEGAARARALFADLRKQKLGYMDNGLEFCLILARTSGCIVRASSLVQSEEFGDSFEINGPYTTWSTRHFIMRGYDRFGDWDGPVWDFLPDGSVRYLGCSIPRHKIRFPVHQVPVPQQLTYNFREQGGNDSGVGQRPQRINRNPLPV